MCHPEFTRNLKASRLTAGDVLLGKFAGLEVAAVEHVEGHVCCEVFHRETLAVHVLDLRADRRVQVER